MKAYHNDEKIKEKYLTRVKEHREADQLVKGTGWENGKGCAVGCTLEIYAHSRYPIELGIPEMLARLEDSIFEGLDNGKSQKWPERFLSSVKVGSDLSMVGPKFLLALIQRRRDALDKEGKKLVGSAMDQVVKVLADWVEFGKADQKAARAAWAAARAAGAAARAAWAAAGATEAARAAGATEAAWAAAGAAEAARAAAGAAEAAARAAWAAEYAWMADKLIELIKQA